MKDKAKRDNSYWLERLERDGRDDLLTMINDGDISVYRATVAAGYRKKRTAPSRAEQLDYHWKRASRRDKEVFVARNYDSLKPFMKMAFDLLKKAKAQKPSE